MVDCPLNTTNALLVCWPVNKDRTANEEYYHDLIVFFVVS